MFIVLRPITAKISLRQLATKPQKLIDILACSLVSHSQLAFILQHNNIPETFSGAHSFPSLIVKMFYHKRENAKYMYNEVAVDEYNKNVFCKQRVKSDKKSICSK